MNDETLMELVDVRVRLVLPDQAMSYRWVVACFQAGHDPLSPDVVTALEMELKKPAH